MKIEKRGEVTPGEAQSAAPEAPAKHKPVLVYLVILFAIAFAMILFSFVMHQRSNAEVLQQLQGQVETLQQLQEVEEKYTAASDENQELRQTVNELENSLQAAEKSRDAMLLLWRLEEAYAAEDIEECEKLLHSLEENDLYLFLPETLESGAAEGAKTPHALYTTIKNAVADAQ